MSWECVLPDASGLAPAARKLSGGTCRPPARNGPDFSARQLGVFSTSYLEDEAQTVRGLAAELNVSKPAITRALDRLSEFDFVCRKTELFRRSVLVQRTVSGTTFLRDLKKIVADTGKDATRVPTTAQRAGGGNSYSSQAIGNRARRAFTYTRCNLRLALHPISGSPARPPTQLCRFRHCRRVNQTGDQCAPVDLAYQIRDEHSGS
jgi:DNA-binding MarR family transcriptional regulator